MVKRTIFTLIFGLGTYIVNAQDSDSDLIIKAVTSLKQEEFEKCREYALKALELNPNLGNAYILIGQAYIESRDLCEDEVFSKGIIFCLAVDKFKKAKEVDSSMTIKADQLNDVYSNYFPSQEYIFGGPVEGEKYKIGCWINEEIIVRYTDY